MCFAETLPRNSLQDWSVHRLRLHGLISRDMARRAILRDFSGSATGGATVLRSGMHLCAMDNCRDAAMDESSLPFGYLRNFAAWNPGKFVSSCYFF